jgi:hypothetical protein
MAFEVQHQVELPTNTFLRAKLKELEVKKVGYADKKTGEQKEFTKLNWLFEITQDGEYFGKTVRAETSAYLSDSPYNNFRLWAEALLQRPLDLGQVLNETDLIGLSALITIKFEEDRRDSSKKFARVEDVIPLDPGSVMDSEPPF